MIWLVARSSRRRRTLIIVLVAVLIAVVEVEQTHVDARVLALTGAMLAGWIGQVVHRDPAWVVMLGGAAIAMEVVHYSQASIAVVTGVVFTLIYLAGYPRLWGLPAAAAVAAAFVTLDRVQSPASRWRSACSAPSAWPPPTACRTRSGVCRRNRPGRRPRWRSCAPRARASSRRRAPRIGRAWRARSTTCWRTPVGAVGPVEGAKLMAETHAGEPREIQALDRAHRLAQEGLQEVRRAVGALRGDRPPGPEGLSDLVGAFVGDSGIACRLEVVGEPVHLTPEAGLTIYRTAQEALTNVRRHADASEVTLRLRYLGEGGAELVVEDTGGPSCPPPQPASASRGSGSAPSFWAAAWRPGRSTPAFGCGCGCRRDPGADRRRPDPGAGGPGHVARRRRWDGGGGQRPRRGGGGAVNRSLNPDVVLMDLRMPRCDGVRRPAASARPGPRCGWWC